MTQHEVEVKFQKYAELGKALDILRTLDKDEMLKFIDDANSIYWEKTWCKPKTEQPPVKI